LKNIFKTLNDQI